MFGWEFPPFNSGGLGVACQGLSFALAQQNTDLLFVLPKKLDVDADYMKLLYAEDKGTISTISVDSNFCLLAKSLSLVLNK